MNRRLLQRRIRIGLPGARQDLWAFVGLAALTIFLFRPAVFGGQVLFIRDISLVWYPQIESFVRCIAAGSWPLWDVHRGFGQPLLADPSAQVLYPLTWLNLLIRPWHYYTLFAVFHLIVSSFGTYLLARRWGCSPAAALLAGAVWGLSGPLLSLVSLWHHLAGATWIPWLLLVADLALSSGRASHAVAWGALAALQIVAGSADMVAITGFALLACALAQHARWRPPRAENRRLARQALLATLVALGLSAALWLPALALARESPRWHLPAGDRTTWSLHPLGLLGLLSRVHWNAVPPLLEEPQALRDLQASLLASVYLGGPLAGFVGAALISRRPRTVFLACLALGSLLLALGRHAGVYDAATSLLPPLRIFRFPVKWLLLAALAWSLLSGLGYDVWRTVVKRADARWVLGWVAPCALLSAFVLGAAVFIGRRRPAGPLRQELLVGACLLAVTALLCLVRCLRRRNLGVPALALAILAVGELAIRQQDIQAFAPRELFTHRPEVLGLVDAADFSRLYVYDYSVDVYDEGQHEGRRGWGYPLARAPLGFSRSAAVCLGMQMYVNAPTTGRWGLYGSYDFDLLGLSPGPLGRLAELLRRVEGTPLHLRLLRLGGVRYVLALHREPWWDDLAPVARVPGLFTVPIQVLRVPDPLPRAYLVSGARIAEVERAFSVLGDPSFDPAREVILASGTPREGAAPSGGTSRITRLDPDRVRVETDARQEGYLVLSDSYDEGWRASIDGREAPLLRANIAFRAVAVPEGRHQVELVYRPKPVALGLLVSAGTATSVIGFGLWRWSRPAPAAA